MNEFIDFLTQNTTLAYVTAFIIFFVTIWLIFKRLIGFMISLVLLAFALLSGLAIANHDLFREILTRFKTDQQLSGEDKYTHFKNQLNKAYEDLKEEFTEQKKKIETMIDAYQKNGNKEEKPAAVESHPEAESK